MSRALPTLEHTAKVPLGLVRVGSAMRSQAVWCAWSLIALMGCAEGFSAGDPLGLALAGAGGPSGDPLGLDTCTTENATAACNCPGAARMGITTCLPNSASSTGFAYG